MHSFSFPVIQHEPWFGSQYIEEDLPESLFKLWSNPPNIDPSLHLPSKNEFIARDFSLRNANANKNLAGGDHPKCIIDKPFIKLWYKIDTTFNVPRANAYFLIALKDGYHTSKNSVLAELFMNLLKDELNDILYQVKILLNFLQIIIHLMLMFVWLCMCFYRTFFCL